MASAPSLHERLRALAGVEGAELRGSEQAPTGLIVRIAPGADAREVMEEVQRVLADYGLRSRLAPPRTRLQPVQPPPPPAPDEDEGLSEEAEPHPRPAPRARATGRLVFVGVEEREEGFTVTVGGPDGRTVTRRSPRTPAGLDQAVVAAVAGLVPGSPTPVLVDCRAEDVGGSTALVAVLEVAGERLVSGSALVRGDRAAALARAVWAALTLEA